jgi:hypothetical protein
VESRRHLAGDAGEVAIELIGDVGLVPLIAEI